MVNDAAVARPDVDRSDVGVAIRGGGRRNRNRVAAILIAVRGRSEGPRVFEHHVRLAEGPTAIEVKRSRKIGTVALRRSGADPFRKGVDISLREDARTVELGAANDRLPRRHLARRGHESNVRGLRVSLLVRHERRGGDIAGVMATIAVLLQDAGHFSAEGRSRIRRGRACRALTRSDQCEQQEGPQSGGQQDSTAHHCNDIRSGPRIHVCG